MPGEFFWDIGGDPIPPHTYLSLGDEIVNGWMNSPPHKSNILSADAKELGCGTAYYTDKSHNYMPMLFATQNFQLFEPIKIIK